MYKTSFYVLKYSLPSTFLIGWLTTSAKIINQMLKLLMTKLW